MVETEEVQERRGVNNKIWELRRELEERRDCCVLDISGEECVVQGADQWPRSRQGLEEEWDCTIVLVMRIFLPQNYESLISL